MVDIECCICLNYITDTNLTSCNTCINKVCNSCINEIDYELDINENNETVDLTYKCPCCISINILNDTHNNYSKIYKEKTTEMIMDMLEMKRSFLYIKFQLKEYETIFEDKYYEVNNDILLTV